MQGASAQATLPSGYWAGNTHHRRVELRPLNGADQEYLVEAGEHWLPVERATAMLTRCITRMEGIERVTYECLADLTAGDREALLLHLRRLTLGERVPCILICPAADCGEKMDLDLQVNELLLAPYAEPQPVYETTVEDDEARYQVCFRLPTGADQALAARLARHDPQAAAMVICERCVEQITTEHAKPVDACPPALLGTLSACMADLDPQAELVLNLHCPHCRCAFSALFDTAAYFFQEITAHMDRLYQEVHLLAFHYHWGESEILGMTPRKRQRYLSLVLDALSEGRAL